MAKKLSCRRSRKRLLPPNLEDLAAAPAPAAATAAATAAAAHTAATASLACPRGSAFDFVTLALSRALTGKVFGTFHACG